ncbi:hypothetical protein LPJ74_004998 [Coemansia sp. RSA 1843]|nr:hypothetical protein LPJ74_004998 [Coemansia sp. RSA 1843]
MHSAIEELGQSAEQVRQMDIATKCRLKRTLLFKDSLLKEKHRAFFDEHFMKHPDNFYLRKGLLVGVFEVPLAELGSGANNIVDFPMVPFKNVTGNGSTISATYKHSGRGLDALTDSFWFNTKEVEGLLEKSAIRFPQIAEHRDKVMAVIKDWYNGYHFGRFRGKYNPWSVCAFIGCLCSQLESSAHGEIRSVPDAIKPAARAYWVATGTTDLIEQQFTNHRDQAIRLMESLIREYRETRLSGLDHDLVLSNSQTVSLQLPKPNMNIISSGKYSTEGMLTLCLFAGYLTHKHPDSVCIPNHEVYNVWCTLFTRTLLGTGFVERTDVNARGSLLAELWEGKTAILSSFIQEAFGTLTNHGKYKEKEYANIVATVLTAASCLGALSPPGQASSHTSHSVTTRENHTGDGQCDHVMRLYSTDNKPTQFGVLIEFKLIPMDKRANTGLHETLAKKALDQIIAKRYPACLSGCTERLDIGIAIGSNVLHVLTQLYKLDAATRKWIPVECLTSSAS